MNNFSKIALILILLLGTGFYSCKKKSKYSNVPEITFTSFEKFGADSAHLTLYFTDGDGDIGVTQAEDTVFNFFTIYYQKKNGVFQIKQPKIPLNFRIPILNSSKKSKSLEGDIVITFLNPYYFPTLTSDTIKYEFYLKDRANNESNHEFSSEIIVP